jgi:hypothetical protein
MGAPYSLGAFHLLEAPRHHRKERMKAKKAKKKCVNPECPGRNPKILGRGLCVTCYSRARTAEKKASLPPPPPDPVDPVKLEELYELARSCMAIAKEALELARDKRKARVR